MILPFELESPIKTDNTDVYTHGIILSREGGMQFLYTIYIDVDFDLRSRDFFYNNFYNAYTYRGPLMKKYCDVSIGSSESLFHDFCKTSIDDGKYIWGICDDYYLPHRIAYKRFKFQHDFLLIGYDENSYYLAGYNDRVKPEIVSVTKKELFDAVYEKRNHQLSTVEVNPNYKFNIDVPYILRQLKIYYVGGMSRILRKYFGITSTLGFIKCFEENILELKPREFPDLAPTEEDDDPSIYIHYVTIFRRYMEHKQMLYKRFMYLADRYKMFDKETFDILSQNAFLGEIIFNMSIKVRISNSRITAEKMIDEFKKIYENEEKLFPKLISYTEALVEKQKDEKYEY